MACTAHFSVTFRTIACGLIALTVSGCSSWQATHLSPPTPGTTSPRADELKIRKTDGQEVTLVDWSLERDSLRGTQEEWVKHRHVRTHEVIALSEVRLPGSQLQGDSLRKVLEAGPILNEACRVKLMDGTTFEMESATVEGDSLRGTMSADVATHQPGRQVALALQDVKTVEVRRHSTGKTAALLLGGAVLAVAAVLGLSFANEMANGN